MDNGSLLRPVTGHLLAIIFCIILIPLGLWGAARYSPENMEVVLFWCAGLGTVGFFLGFLFALPRYSKRDLRASNNPPEKTGLDVNTNLLDIADWLTKIIVGLGLVELRRAPQLLRELSAYMAGGFSRNGSEQFAAALILYFCTIGFLSGYLLTRLEINRLIRAADMEYTRPFLAGVIEDIEKGDDVNIHEGGIVTPGGKEPLRF